MTHFVTRTFRLVLGHPSVALYLQAWPAISYIYREIKQREQTNGEHQRTAERFTHQVIREVQNEINPQQSKGMER